MYESAITYPLVDTALVSTRRHKIAFSLLYLYIIFLPIIQLKINVAAFGLTISDIILVLLIICLRKIKIPKEYNLLYYSLFFYLFAMLLSLFNAVSISSLLIHLIPVFYSLIISIIVIKLKEITTLQDIKNLKKVISVSLIISFIPLYLFLFGVHIPKTFFIFEYIKYRYLCIVSNQYSMYCFALFSYTIFLSIKFFPKKLIADIILLILSLTPIFYSASRSGSIIIILLLFLVTILLFMNSKLGGRMLIVVLLFLIIKFLISFFADFEKMDWNVKRALSFYEQFESKGKVGVDEWRENQYANALPYFYNHPILGVGLGNFAKVTHDHEVHNTYLSLLCETGIIGFMSYIFYILIISIFYLKENKTVSLRLFYFSFLLIFLAVSYSALLIRERWIWLIFTIFFITDNVKQYNKLVPQKNT